LGKLWSRELKHVFLGHLSKENNYPALAYESVRLEMLKVEKNFETYTKLQIASRDTVCDPVFV